MMPSGEFLLDKISLKSSSLHSSNEVHMKCWRYSLDSVNLSRNLNRRSEDIFNIISKVKILKIHLEYKTFEACPGAICRQAIRTCRQTIRACRLAVRIYTGNTYGQPTTPVWHSDPVLPPNRIRMSHRRVSDFLLLAHSLILGRKIKI